MHVNFLTCGLIVEYIFCNDFSIQESWQDFGIDFELSIIKAWASLLTVP